ncbi:MAG: RNA polymerase sigma factor [Candidatus Velamenicoccus archaeovorus]
MAVGPLTRQGVDPTDANQLGDAVLEAMTALSEREREALMLVYWDDLDIAVAAAVAECSPRAMTTRLHRARRHLALHLARAGVLHLIDEQANPHDRARAGRSEP